MKKKTSRSFTIKQCPLQHYYPVRVSFIVIQEDQDMQGCQKNFYRKNPLKSLVIFHYSKSCVVQCCNNNPTSRHWTTQVNQLSPCNMPAMSGGCDVLKNHEKYGEDISCCCCWNVFVVHVYHLHKHLNGSLKNMITRLPIEAQHIL